MWEYYARSVVYVVQHNRTKSRTMKPQVCTINHDGSSVSMEVNLGCQMVESICDDWNKAGYVDGVVFDDDSKLRFKLRHANNACVLKNSAQEPYYHCDPRHRTKVMVKKTFGMVKSKKDKELIKNRLLVYVMR